MSVLLGYFPTQYDNIMYQQYAKWQHLQLLQFSRKNIIYTTVITNNLAKYVLTLCVITQMHINKYDK